MRGWASAGLPSLGDDASYWTVAEAALMLVVPEDAVRNMIRVCGIAPAGKRRSGPRSRGRYPLVYPAVRLIAAYDAVTGVADSGTPC